MAENPAYTLGRLVGGIVMTQGRLGHQVLGQMLIVGSDDIALAGATLVVAGTSRQRSAVAQVALRTAATALALHAVFARDAKRLARVERALAERERRLEDREKKVAKVAP